MNMNRACDLECVPNRPYVTTFIGPVKILLVEPDPNVYRKKYWLTSLLAFCMFLMGATVTVMILNTFFLVKATVLCNFHVFCGTVATQILLPVGMLNIHPYHAPAALMLNSRRVCEHIVTQMVAFLFLGFATLSEYFHFFMYALKKVKIIEIISIHAVAGFSATSLCFLAMFFGCWFRLYGKRWRLIHSSVAVAAFLLSSICFLTGLWKPSILIWFTRAPATPMFISVTCILYTIIISSYPIYHLIKMFYFTRNSENRRAEQLSS